PGRRQGSRKGGLYDSVDAGRFGPAPASPFFADRSPQGSDAPAPAGAGGGGGSGGISGLHDPYDRPTRSRLKGAQATLRLDKQSGALQEVAGRYRMLFAGQHLVRKGLRRSIADAYAAYVGQVVDLPHDTYGLALMALDRTFNGSYRRTAKSTDFNLGTTPFATSKAKHAQIFNTAHKIMRDLDGYVHDVSYYCPGELDELRGVRGPGTTGAQAGGGGGYK
ncbi:hypothetical protein TSOC_014841, partial [Tetrabaena socialis]